MNKTKLLFSIIVIIIFSLIIGVALGIFYQNQRQQNICQQSTSINIKDFSSDVIVYLLANGEAVDVNNQSITLKRNEDLMTISIKTNATVYRFNDGQRKQINFSDIKIGDQLNITTSIDSNGKLIGNSILISN